MDENVILDDIIEADPEVDAADEPEAAAASETAEAMQADPSLELQRQIDELRLQLRAAEEDRVRRERELECLGILEAAGLPSGLAAVVQSAEDMAGAVELIRRTVQAKVEAEVSRRCRSDAPAVGTRVPLSKAELARMPVAELQRLWTQQQ